MKIGVFSRFLAGFAAILMVSACGGSDEDTAADGSGQPGAPQAASGQGQNTAAKAPSRRCPAKPASAPRAEGAPVDDILGIRPGMSYDDAVWILACRDELAAVETGEKWNVNQTHGFPTRQIVRASNGVPCTSQEILRGMSGAGQGCDDGGYRFKALKDITEQVVVVFSGMMGDEKAGGIWRRSVFAADQYPAVDSLVQSLTTKYGAPQMDATDRRNIRQLTWVYDLLGRPMSTSAANHNVCANVSIQASFNGSHAWRSDCGLTIKAAIQPDYNNPLLAREMNIGIMHQKEFYDRGQEFEQALKTAYEQRTKDEAEAAAKRAPAPEL